VQQIDGDGQPATREFGSPVAPGLNPTEPRGGLVASWRTLLAGARLLIET